MADTSGITAATNWLTQQQQQPQQNPIDTIGKIQELSNNVQRNRLMQQQLLNEQLTNTRGTQDMANAGLAALGPRVAPILAAGDDQIMGQAQAEINLERKYGGAQPGLIDALQGVVNSGDTGAVRRVLTSLLAYSAGGANAAGILFPKADTRTDNSYTYGGQTTAPVSGAMAGQPGQPAPNTFQPTNTPIPLNASQVFQPDIQPDLSSINKPSPMPPPITIGPYKPGAPVAPVPTGAAATGAGGGGAAAPAPVPSGAVSPSGQPYNRSALPPTTGTALPDAVRVSNQFNTGADQQDSAILTALRNTKTGPGMSAVQHWRQLGLTLFPQASAVLGADATAADYAAQATKYFNARNMGLSGAGATDYQHTLTNLSNPNPEVFQPAAYHMQAINQAFSREKEAAYRVFMEQNPEANIADPATNTAFTAFQNEFLRQHDYRGFMTTKGLDGTTGDYQTMLKAIPANDPSRSSIKDSATIAGRFWPEN